MIFIRSAHLFLLMRLVYVCPKHIALTSSVCFVSWKPKILVIMYKVKREVFLRVVLQAQKRRNSVIASPSRTGSKEGSGNEASHCLQFSKMPAINGLVRNYLELAWKGGAQKYQEVGMDRFDRLGPAYKETIFGETIVHLNDPVDIEKVFRACNGKIVNRGLALFPFVYYNRRAGYKDGMPGDGQSWYEHRSPISRKMLRPLEVKAFLQQFIDVADDSIARLEPDEGDPSMRVISKEALVKWACESLGTVLFGYRLDANVSQPSDRVCDVLANIETAVTMHGKMIILYPFYKYFDTPTWRVYKRSMRLLYEHTVYFIEKGAKRVHETPFNSTSILDHLVSTKALPPSEIEQSLIYLFLGGMDTTAITAIWFIHLLSQNPNVQNKLSGEIEMVLKGEKPSSDSFDKMPYLRACVKETLRLYPLTVGTTRIPDKPVAVAGYEVPAGLTYLLWNFASSQQEKIFNEPESFKPERWLRNNSMELAHGFASLPFGFGPRMCPGRRISEYELYVLVSRLLQKFEVIPTVKSRNINRVFRWLIFPSGKPTFQLRKRE